ncbi:MAG: CCA tRNA nucleotidyltransferase [Alcaligenaceae bacterium]
MSADHVTEGLQVYIVGGAVRDALLGLPAGDRDWVVVGATPEEMAARGFIPVGGDFPVFLHPITKEEYALARTERKSGRGYKGFTFYTGPEVTLEEDLKRRDLTVNAIAQSMTGERVDPLKGAQDLRAKILRHVGPAFEEDPVRILRLARFMARFTEFAVAPETLVLCYKMVASGEVDALVPERVWQELSRGLMSEQPSRMLGLLAEVGAASRTMPELVLSPRIKDLVDRVAQQGLPLVSRYAVLCLQTSELKAFATRLRVPSECADMARLLPLVLAAMLQLSEKLSPGKGGANDGLTSLNEVDHALKDAEHADAVLSLFETCDALRKPERFEALLQTAGCVDEQIFAKREVWQSWLQIVLAVDAGAAARSASAPDQIKQWVRAARLAALQAC